MILNTIGWFTFVCYYRTVHNLITAVKIISKVKQSFKMENFPMSKFVNFFYQFNVTLCMQSLNLFTLPCPESVSQSMSEACSFERSWIVQVCSSKVDSCVSSL